MNIEQVTPIAFNVRYHFSELPGLRALFQDYKDDITRFDPGRFKAIAYFGGRYPIPVQQPRLPRRIFRKMKHYLNR
jgi:hypothetical protein